MIAKTSNNILKLELTKQNQFYFENV